MDTLLSVWTVYERPADYPDHFVARRCDVWPEQIEPVATTEVLLDLSLDGLRRQLPEGLICRPRSFDDDPAVMETWT